MLVDSQAEALEFVLFEDILALPLVSYVDGDSESETGNLLLKDEGADLGTLRL